VVGAAMAALEAGAGLLAGVARRSYSVQGGCGVHGTTTTLEYGSVYNVHYTTLSRTGSESGENTGVHIPRA
jgi:hypothetical protein